MILHNLLSRACCPPFQTRGSMLLTQEEANDLCNRARPVTTLIKSFIKLTAQQHMKDKMCCLQSEKKFSATYYYKLFHRCDSDGMYKKEDFIEILTKWNRLGWVKMSCSYVFWNKFIWFCIDKSNIFRAMIPWILTET